MPDSNNNNEEKMKPIKCQSVKIPIKKASRGKETTEGRLHGSGDVAIIFSNMDTNNQEEWSPVINDLISEKYIFLTYDYLEHKDD